MMADPPFGPTTLWPEGVTGEVTAAVDPRGVPYESQAKMNAPRLSSEPLFQQLTTALDFRLRGQGWNSCERSRCAIWQVLHALP